MAIKQGEVKEQKNNGLDELGLEMEYSEGTQWAIDTSNLDKIKLDDLDIGTTVDGIPEFRLFDNSDKTNADGSPRKWDSIALHLADIQTDEYGETVGEYVEAYVPCPRPDQQGNISNIFGNGFYHGCFNLIYSYLRTLDENNVLDSNGNIKNTIKRINIVKLLEKLNDLEHMEIKVMKGANGDEQYLTYMITEMK